MVYTFQVPKSAWFKPIKAPCLVDVYNFHDNHIELTYIRWFILYMFHHRHGLNPSPHGEPLVFITFTDNVTSNTSMLLPIQCVQIMLVGIRV